MASLRAMQRGLFSADPANPWRADAAALARITPASASPPRFSIAPGNELLGLAGRAALLRRLGEVCAADPTRFGAPARPGNLYDFWRPHRRPAAGGRDPEHPAPRVRADLARPDQPRRCAARRLRSASAVPGDGLVPFHKLSQWLAYSLVEPLAAGGYRGRRARRADRPRRIPQWRTVSSIAASSCRATPPCCNIRSMRRASRSSSGGRLTVALLDRLAPRVRERLGKNAPGFPARLRARRRQLGRRPRNRVRAPAGRQRAAKHRQRRHLVLGAMSDAAATRRV